jgi:hypothetical protein
MHRIEQILGVHSSSPYNHGRMHFPCCYAIPVPIPTCAEDEVGDGRLAGAAPKERSARGRIGKVATIFAEQRTGDLTHKEAIAYDITSALIAGLVPPALIYEQAVGLFVKMEQRNSSILSVCTASYRSP